MTRLDFFLHAAREIPVGETRSFAELAAMAGAPAGARAAGRVMRACGPRSRVPWHRVVRADGGLDADPRRATLQLGRLRHEGARPRAGESVAHWARRRGWSWVGSYRTRRILTTDDARVERFDPPRCEGFASLDAARARGFGPEGRSAALTVSLPRTARGRVPAADLAALRRRLDRLRWDAIERALCREGVVRLPAVLAPRDCARLLATGADERRFDRGVHMQAKGYGIGTYRYWKEPLPEPAGTLRRALYARLRVLAARLEPASGPFPATLARYHALCRADGQGRPSSILISYLAGGQNHPHQDAYGPRCFPLQALVVLARRGVDFTGGDFVLWRERGDGGLEAREVAATRGDLVLFCARRLGPAGPRVLHGMRPLRSGRRDALGLVLHLAR